MDITSMSAILDNQYKYTKDSEKAGNATNSVSGITAESSDEEIEKAVKSFETYMMEQIIKEVKESIKGDDKDEDSTMSQYKDYFMDTAISTIAGELVDQIGGDLTEDLVAQIKRNVGITSEVE